MTRRFSRPGVWSLFVVLALIAVGGGRAAAQQSRFTASFTVGGQVAAPRSYTLADLQALPAEEVAVAFTSGGRPQQRTYTGVRLHRLLADAQPAFTNDAFNWYITVTAADGYTATLSWAEIAPDYADRPVLVAYLEDGALMQSNGMARLVVPGDSRGSRYVSNISRITVQRAEPPKPPVAAFHAGSLNSVMTRAIGPGFTAATGYPFSSTGGPSVGLANQIRSGAITPDVYMTADAVNIPDLLMGTENGNLARWYMVMARQKMVLAYAPRGRFAADFEAAAAGSRSWYEVLAMPGLKLKRGDPRNDPGGYRSYFVFLLAERFYSIPGLAERLSGGAENLAQIEGYSITAVRDGTVDAAITYLSNAVDAGVPYLSFPEEIDQSSPALDDLYRTATYTNPLGQRFTGSALVYGVTIPEAAPNLAGAEAFVRYLLSEQGRAALAASGFLPADVLFGGSEEAVPASLRPLIQGRYGR